MLEVKETPVKRYSPKKDERALLKTLDDLFDARLKKMREKMRQWQLNMAFVRGRQWARWDRVRGTIVDLRPRKAGQARIVFNLIGPFARSTLSMLSQSNPTMDVIPASYSTQDETAAKSAQVHLDRIDVVNKKSVNDILIRRNLIDFGTAYRLVFWNPQIHMEEYIESAPDTMEEMIRRSNPPKPMPEKDASDQAWLKRAQGGEVDEMVCSPFEILVDYPLVKRGNQIRDFIRYRLVSIDYIRRHYKKGIFVNPEKEGQFVVLNEILRNDEDIFNYDQSSQQVVLKEYYEAPTKEHPYGRNVHWAGHVILHDGRLSHPQGKLCLFDYHWEIDPNDFFGEGYVQPLIEPQVIINRIFSRMADYLNKIAKFRIAVPRNSQFSRSKYSQSGTGDVFEYNDPMGTGITNIDIPEMPASYFKHLQEVIAVMRDIASRHEVSKGQAPGRVDSGRGIDMLQRADSDYLIPPMIIWEERERQVAKAKLEFMRAYYKDPRSARILGEGRKLEIYTLKAADLSEGIDVNIVRGSSMPINKQAQNNYIIELFQMGLMGDVTDPTVRSKTLRLLDLGGVEGLFGTIEQGVNLQLWEIRQILEGEQATVEAWHNHYVHNYEILKFMNSPKFKTLPPQIQEAIVDHWRRHADFIKAMNSGGLPPEEEKPAPMPGAGGKVGLPQAVNPQAK